MISSETSTPGSGGAIEVVADRVTLAGDALISAQSGISATGGKAGDISIAARDTLQIDHSAVATAADHAEGGAITLAANRVRLGEGAVISARSSGAGNAGNIRITARDTLQGQNNRVTTESLQSGGGQIELYAGSMAHLRGSQITTTVQGGAGDAGNITLQGIEQEAGSGAPTRSVVLNDSQVIARAVEGRGGNIRIAAGMFLADPGSWVDASSKLGIDGTVDIRAPVTQISGSLAPL